MANIPAEYDFATGPTEVPRHLATFSDPDVRQRLDSLGLISLKTVAPTWRHLERNPDPDGAEADSVRVTLVDFADVYLLRFAPGHMVEELRAATAALVGVRYAECNSFVGSLAVPNDPLQYPDQWHHHNGGQLLPGELTPCTGDIDINSRRAWDIWTDTSTKVAIIDGGIDRYHPDLAGRIDISLSKSFTTSPWWVNVSHGSAVAGVAAASTNNSVGIAGVCNWPVDTADSVLVAYRVTEGTTVPPDALVSNICGALAEMCSPSASSQIRIANLSVGVEKRKSCPPATLRDCMRNAYLNNKVLTAAAGNNAPALASCSPSMSCYPHSTSPPDTCMVYPAAFNDFALAVGAIDCFAQASFNPQMSAGYVDIAAPGSRITTVASGGGYSGSSNGSSLAAPLSAGIAALLVGLEPQLTNDDVYEILRRTARNLPGLPSITVGRGLVQADSVLSYIAYPRKVNHGFFGHYSAAYDGEGWVWLKNVAGVNSTTEIYEQFYVDRYRILSTGALKNPYPTTAIYDAIWGCGRTSSGWRRIDDTIEGCFDAHLFANYCGIFSWVQGSNTATVETYTYHVFRDAAKTQEVCWAPFKPSGQSGTACGTGGMFRVDFTYLTRPLIPEGGVRSPWTPTDVGATEFSWRRVGDLVRFSVHGDPYASRMLRVCNVSGRVLYHAIVPPGQHQTDIDWPLRSSYVHTASGIYFASLQRRTGGQAARLHVWIAR